MAGSSTPPELSPEDEALWDMSDEELEAAVKQAREESLQEAEENDTITEEENDLSDNDVDEQESEVMEQPEADEESTEEDSENDEDETDVDTEDSEEVSEETDQSDEEETEETEEETETDSEPEKLKFKANGMDFEFTVDEMKAQFGKAFGQAMDYTKKMQEIKPWRKTISAMQENGISEEDVNLLIDATKGNKEAISALLAKNNVDPMDLEMEQASAYKPNSYGKDSVTQEIDEVVNRISNDPEYSMTRDVVNRQWDAESQDTLAKNPNLIDQLHQDIKTGLYAEVAPIAMKLKFQDGGTHSDINYYVEAMKQYVNKQEADNSAKAENDKTIQQEVERQAKQKRIQQDANKKKAATLPKSKAGRKTVVDYLDDDDEAFEEWYKKTMSEM